MYRSNRLHVDSGGPRLATHQDEMAAPLDAQGLRALSDRPIRTRWKPVDLVCRRDEEELIVRTKLARDAESSAVCIAEAVSHAFLRARGFRMAEAFAVAVEEEFARDLTAQYGFDPAIRPGRHWGTRLMRRGVQEIEFAEELVGSLANPSELFDLYLADMILANPDRTTHGNVLLATRDGQRSGFELIPIDQSDAFFHPGIMIDSQALRKRFTRSKAELLDGTESIVARGGPDFVAARFAETRSFGGRMREFVAACVDEWYDRADVDPDLLEEFLEHRVQNLDTLAHKSHWLDVASMGAEVEYVLDLR